MALSGTPSGTLSPESIDAWRKNIRNDTFANYHREMGKAILKEGNLGVAAEHFERALSFLPDSCDVQYLLVETLRELGRTEDTERRHTEASESNPHYQADARRRFGAEHLREGRSDEAAAEFATALTLEPGHPEALIGHALARVQKGDFTALVPMNEAAALRVRPGTIHLDLLEAGLSLTKQLRVSGSLAPAAEVARCLTHLDPDEAEAHALLGEALYLQSRFAEAAEVIRRAVELADYSADYHFKLGSSLINLPGRAPDAEAVFQRASELDPALPFVHSWVRQAWVLQGRLPETIACLEKLCTTDPGRRNELAIIQMVGGHFSAAQQIFEKVLAEGPNDAGTLGYLAIALNAQGETGQAIAAVERALGGGVHDLWLNGILALCHLQAGNPTKAEEVMERTGLNRSDGHPYSIYAAAVLNGSGRYAEALEKAKKAIDVQPCNVWRVIAQIGPVRKWCLPLFEKLGFTRTSFWVRAL